MSKNLPRSRPSVSTFSRRGLRARLLLSRLEDRTTPANFAVTTLADEWLSKGLVMVRA